MFDGRRVDADAATRADVIAAYRLFLGREPESARAIRSHLDATSVADLRARFVAAIEFQRVLTASQENGWVVCEPIEGARLWVELADRYVSSSLLHEGRWEPGETAYMLEQVRPGMVVVDVGAYVGWFTLNAAHAVGSEGRVHAFEPNPEVVGYLSRSVQESGIADRVTVHALALGETSRYASLGRDLAEQNLGHAWLLTEQEAAEPGFRSSEVEVVRLDDVVEGRVDFIKIDIEGAEPLALAGAERILREHRPVIMSEVFPEQMLRVCGVTPDAYFDRIEAFGYDCRLLVGSEATVRPTADMIEGPLYTVVFEPRSRPSPG